MAEERIVIRLLQAAVLTAAAVVGVAEFDFGWVELAVAMLGAMALAGSGELALTAPAAVCTPRVRRRWDVEALARRAEMLSGRDAVRDEQRARLLARLRELAEPGGLLPAELDDLVRESLPELVE